MLENSRRRCNRVPYSDECLLFIGDAKSGEKCQVKNLSVGGLALVTDEILNEQEVVTLRFGSVDEEPVEEPGRIIYTERQDDGHYLVGIEFLRDTENSPSGL